MIALFLFVLGGISLFVNLSSLVVREEETSETITLNIASCAVQSALLVLCVGGGIGQFIYSLI